MLFGAFFGTTQTGDSAIKVSNNILWGKEGVGEYMRMTSSGDFSIKTQGKGMILRATDGANCYRVTVNNAGVLSTGAATCP